MASAVGAGATALDVPEGAPLFLAVSGGPDSMALLYGAARLVASGVRRWTLTVAHLDHGLRPDSTDDAHFVTDAADRLGLECAVRSVDVATLARTDGRSIEEAGREARYRFLEEVAVSGALIATAHTLDDSVETILLNLLRGSGLTGVTGIPARRGRIVRPLLGERRSHLREQLVAGALPFRDDPSNTDPVHLRNRVRAELMPVLENLRSGATERIARFGQLAADDDAALDDLAAAELARRLTPDGTIDWRDPPPPAVGRRVLRLAIGPPAPTAERLGALLEAANGDRGGLRIELGHGRRASVHARRIEIE